MRFGIYDITRAAPDETIVYCSDCDNFYYEDITDERNDNQLRIFKDGEESFKGCPECKADECLVDYFVAEKDR